MNVTQVLKIRYVKMLDRNRKLSNDIILYNLIEKYTVESYIYFLETWEQYVKMLDRNRKLKILPNVYILACLGSKSTQYKDINIFFNFYMKGQDGILRQTQNKYLKIVVNVFMQERSVHTKYIEAFMIPEQSLLCNILYFNNICITGWYIY